MADYSQNQIEFILLNNKPVFLALAGPQYDETTKLSWTKLLECCD